MRIAIIGTGISGMVAAYLLHQEHELTIFEANDYIGGHTHTIDLNMDGRNYAVDTGFIVFNEKTYPNFVKLMKEVGVSWKPSNMSFSVRCEQTGLEYCSSSFTTLFAQRRNLLSAAFYRMILDLFRFRYKSQELLSASYDVTLADYLYQTGYSKMFAEKFILPMGAAIWSADPETFRQFPARYFVEFFNNHGFLNLFHQPQWLVIEGGSKRYVERLTQSYADCIRLGCRVERIKRTGAGVEIEAVGQPSEGFDQVIIATHSDQALKMLYDATPSEREILSAIPYQENVTVLHTDTSLLPRHTKCWASWNYLVPEASVGGVAVTYNMNILQSLEAHKTFCVTLNLPSAIDSQTVIEKMRYHHPVVTPGVLKARNRREEINGKNRTFFCGAYWGYGFHEDGVNSALDVCRHFGKGL
jgi:predicted NAD/FAD-binding protein